MASSPTTSSDNENNKNEKLWEELIGYVPRYDTDRVENDASNDSIFYGNILIEPLPSNYRGWLLSRWPATHVATQTVGWDSWSTPLRWAQMPWYT
jgi:hypothetical protein